MKSIASHLRTALGIAALIETFAAVVFFLGFFVFDGLGRLVEVSHFPSIQLLPTWDRWRSGGSPYQWMLAVIFLQFMIWFVAALTSLLAFRRWRTRRKVAIDDAR